MDFSKNKGSSTSSGGEDLIANLVDLTALPSELIESELQSILSKAGCQPQDLTLDELREAMLKYLEEVHPELETQS